MGVNVGRPDVLIKLNEQDGKLTFDGVPVCDGQHGGGHPLPVGSAAVTLTDNFADLDPTAADGSLALAWNPEYTLSPLRLGAYNEDKDQYLLPNQLVAIAPEIEYRESVFTNALQTYLTSYPLQYYPYSQGETFSRDRAERGVFRKNSDGSYTDITESIRFGEDVSGYWYADRRHNFRMEAGVSTTHKDWTVWGREEMNLCAAPVVTDAQDNVFKRERVECSGILGYGIVAPNASTKYVIAAAWEGDPLQRTFLDLFPGASQISGNIYRVPIMFIYAFEDMDAFIMSEDEDDPSIAESISFHLQTGWNALYVTAAMRLNAREKEWQMESADFDSVVPLDSAPGFAVQTDETGTIEYERENADLLFNGALMRKTEVHPSGLYIKTENWQPIHAGMLPRLDVDRHDGDINVLYERVDEMENVLEDNPPIHYNRQVLDKLNDDSGFLTYDGYRFRTVTSISFETRYDGFDSYYINYSDGTKESFCIQHAPAPHIESITFDDGGQARPEGCDVRYSNGETKSASVTGLDLNVAFSNFHDPELHSTRVFGDDRVYLKLGGSCTTESGYSQYIDLGDYDREVARLDYMDMVLGTGFLTENRLERVQRNYSAAYWDLSHLRQAVVHGWITPAEFKSLTGGMTYEEDDTNDQG